MTMVERVARAFAQGEGYNPDQPVLDEGPMWKQFVPGARAAIAAIEETHDIVARNNRARS